MMLKACIKKEFLESLREHKLIIIFMGFIFFSLATPPLLKLTPKLLEDQYGEEISSLMNFTAINSVENYIGSTFSQICILILALAIGGVLSNELNTKSIVIPFTKGIGKSTLALAKIIYYSIVVSINTFEYKWNPYNLIGTSSILKYKDVSVCLYISIVLIIVFLSLTVRIFKNRNIYN